MPSPSALRLPRLAVSQCAFVAMLALASSAPAFAQWEQATGTAGLNMQSLLSRNGFAYAGGATGAYRSADGGASFVPSNTGNDAAGPTRCFATDESYVYTSTSQGVFRSADDGATWVARSVGLPQLLTSGILQADAHLFVVGPSGVFRSDNHGDTWAAAGLAGVDVRCIAAIAGTLFVGTNGSGVYRSADWGATWTASGAGMSATNIRAIQAKGSTLFAGGQVGTGVYRSTNLGVSWTLLGGGLPSGSYRGFASDDRLIVAGSFGAGVYCSVDNGDHWRAINAGLADLTIFDLEIHQGSILAATNSQGVFRLPITSLSDLDGNGCVDGLDLGLLLAQWGCSGACTSDLDGDGSVGGSDLGWLLAHWGPCR